MLKNKNKPNLFLIYGLLIGAVIGMVFFDNLAMGAALGVGAGIIVGKNFLLPYFKNEIKKSLKTTNPLQQ